MYNKLFTKILDSSIWLEPTPTRIVWLTMLAAMDESGFVQFASVPNLAHRARLTIPETEEAVKCLEAPDTNSSDPEHEGRRVERVPGGWMILNAGKYREMVTRVIIKEQTRERVRKFREKKASNGKVAECNASVTPSDTEPDSSKPPKAPAAASPPLGGGKKDVLPTTPEALAISELFNRKPHTAWSPKEIAKYRDLVRRQVATLESIACIAEYYRGERSKGAEGRHRRDLGTFLNNFDGELDRAQAATNGSNGVRSPEHHIPSTAELDAR